MYTNNKVGNVIYKVIEYFGDDVRRINHFLKVYGYVKMIGECENLDDSMQEILEVTAVLHDVGIKVAEQKYNSSAGHYQQLEGPPVAKKILDELGYPDDFVERVMYLIAHHHTYTNIDGMDYQILVEADFLVNLFENASTRKVIRSVDTKIFRTAAGRRILHAMFALDGAED
mgnify:CR=1 FL=1